MRCSSSCFQSSSFSILLHTEYIQGVNITLLPSIVSSWLSSQYERRHVHVSLRLSRRIAITMLSEPRLESFLPATWLTFGTTTTLVDALNFPICRYIVRFAPPPLSSASITQNPPDYAGYARAAVESGVRIFETAGNNRASLFELARYIRKYGGISLFADWIEAIPTLGLYHSRIVDQVP